MAFGTKFKLKEQGSELGDVFRTVVIYRDNDGQKERPVIVVEKYEDEYIAVSLKVTKTEITGKPWDGYKVPILNWRRAGLTDPSYVECDSLVLLRGDTIVEYMGQMHLTDFERVKRRYLEYLQDNELI